MLHFFKIENFHQIANNRTFLAITFYLHTHALWKAFLESKCNKCNFLQNENLLCLVFFKIEIFHGIAKNRKFLAITFYLHIRMSKWVAFLESTCNLLQNEYPLSYTSSKLEFFIKWPKTRRFSL